MHSGQSGPCPYWLLHVQMVLEVDADLLCMRSDAIDIFFATLPREHLIEVRPFFFLSIGTH